MIGYSANSYLVYLLDEEGKHSEIVPADSFLDGQSKGDEAIQQGLCSSFAVVRVLYNSGTPQIERYDYRVRS